MADAAYVPLYGSGSSAITGDVMASRIAATRGLSAEQVDAAAAQAGRYELPPLRRAVDLRTARPAVTYYACALLGQLGQGRLF